MKYDILKFNTDDLDVKINANRISGLLSKQIQKSSARVFSEGKIYSSAFVGNCSDEELISKARKDGNVGLEFDYELPQTAALKALVPSSTNREKALEDFKEFFGQLQEDYPSLIWNGTATFSSTATSFQGSYTGDLHSGGDNSQLGLTFKNLGSIEMEGYIYLRSAGLNFKKIRADHEPLLQVVGKKAEIRSKKMPVLLVEPYDLVGRLDKDVRPDRYHAGSSPLTGKLGQKIFSSQFQLSDYSWAPEHGLFDRFDGEGVHHHNPSIFKDGVLTNILYDLRQAKKAGKQSTGNGKRAYNSGVSFGHHELIVNPGTQNFWDLVKSVPECLVVTMGFGGGINDQWDYSTPVQTAYLARHGELIGKIPPVTITGNLQQILGDDLIGVTKGGLAGALQTSILTHMEVLVHN